MEATEEIEILESSKPEEQRIVAHAHPKQAAKMLIPYAGIAIAYVVHAVVPDVYPANYEGQYWGPTLLGCAVVYTLFYVVSLFLVPVRKKVERYSWLIAGIFVVLEVYDLLTIKSGILKMPFIPSPDRIIEQFVLNFSTIMSSAAASLQMLGGSLFIGLVVGFASGVLCGCSRIANYWLNPLLKIVGPVPGLVWLPVFVMAFHTSVAGSIAAIVLSVWFPMTLMLSNAIRNTPVELIERAETLGSSKVHTVCHVMIPNAVPSLASALFMALAGSFGALSAAELCGVKSGLTLAIRMMGTIANYGLVFAYVFVMIVIFSTLTIIMFAVRNWLLRWQRGLVRW